MGSPMHGDSQGEPPMEMEFFEQSPPAWWRQITVRSVVTSAVLGAVFSFIMMRIGLTAAIVPSFNMSAGLVSFFVIKTWTGLLGRCGVASQPFTRQENTVVQTCVISCATLALYGGFTTYLIAMTETMAKSFGPVSNGEDAYTLQTGKIMAFLFLVSFASLFCTLPLRKVMIVEYKLMYPTGSAIAKVINNLHAARGAPAARLQVLVLLKSIAGSFFWAFFQWFYTGGNDCGFQAFPLFGLKAYKHKFYFDFSSTLVGVGMICPYVINLSMLLGSIISWAILWPIIESKKGNWYMDSSKTSFKGINGYKVPMAISMVIGDCTYQLCEISMKTAWHFYKEHRRQKLISKDTSDENSDEDTSLSYDDECRDQIFLNDQIAHSFAVVGYILLATISTIFIPHIFEQLRYYHVAFAYAVAPLLAFCNSYASGLTDWSLSTVYGKLAIFVIGAWVGESSGGVIAGLAACGIMMVIIGNAADLMQDFKTGYLTHTSPRSMFISQVIGMALGCIINPVVFLGFQKVIGKEHLGEAGSMYSAPMALAYRGVAVLSVKGVETLPRYSVRLCIVCFILALFINCLKSTAKDKNWCITKYIPSPMAMAVPFFVGPSFAIDMCVGSLILFAWNRIARQSADRFASIVASGLICGDGLWALPSSMFSIFNLEPPICMKFLSRHENEQVDRLLLSLATSPH